MIDVNAGLLVLFGFLVLVMLRIPVFIALIAPALVYVLFNGFPMLFPAQRLVRMLNSYTLLAIPLFIFVGSLMNHGKVTDKIFDFANNLVGHLDGGLAQVNIMASLVFSGISGSALADIGGIGRILIHTMHTEGYDRSYAAAITSASSTVGPIFPPSIPLIIFGLVANVSVLALLLAGILPAVLTVMLLMVGTLYLAKTNDFPTNNTRPSVRRIVTSFSTAFPALATPVVLLAGMLMGIFGPTEAAAVTIIYILAINTVFYRIFNLEYIWTAGLETVRTTGAVIIILAGSGLFSFVMSVENIDGLFAELLFSVSQDPIVVLLLVNVLLLGLGLFIDPIAALIMSIPIVFPPLVEIGLDPVHIGVVMVFNLMVGLLTPPLGLSVFLSADIADVPVETVIADLKLYYVILFVALLFITYVPVLSLWIPQVVG